MAGTYDYSQMLDLVGAYYGSGSDQWLKVAGAKETSADELLKILKQTPGVEPLVTESGKYAGWRLASQESYGAVSNVGSLVNSNTAGGSVAVQSSGTIQVPGQFAESAGKVTVKSGAAATGTKVLQFVSGEIVPATIAVATGLKLGYTIDKALYDINPDIFTYNGVEFWNPDIMKDISLIYREEGLPLQEKLWNGLWGINPDDGTAQLYAEETQFAYMAGYMQAKSLFNTQYVYPDYKKNQVIQFGDIPFSTVEAVVASTANAPDTPPYSKQKFNELLAHYGLSEPTGFFQLVYDGSGSESNYGEKLGAIKLITISPTPPTARVDTASYYSSPYFSLFSSAGYVIDTYTIKYNSKDTLYGHSKDTSGVFFLLPEYSTSNRICEYCNYGTVQAPEAGMGTQSGAVYPTIPNTTNISDIITALKEQYPELWDSAVTNDVLQPDGSIKTFTYLPLPTPTSNSKYDTQPTGDGSEQNQKDTDVKPDSGTQIKDSTTTTIVSPPATPNPPDTGGGDSPTVVPPVGKASSLWSIYNPTLEQVNQFGSWLWSSDFVEQLKKLFSDPMQAIIGLHKVYSPVQTTGQGTIKCGYLDSEVPSKLVSEQYVTVDCGSVDMQEYFGNVFDYPPYTEVSIYLPFIGIRQLDPSDVMRSTISVKYHIDVLTGACLAEVNVQRDASGGTLYTFSGDAAVRYPVSSGSYMGIVSGLIGVATSIVSGNLLPALGGATRLHTNVDRSGSFTGNSGAMGSKVPYIIISRPQTAMADKFETLSGYPSNTYTPLSACKGFTHVKYCHVENLSATETEKTEIERLLKEGVIL